MKVIGIRCSSDFFTYVALEGTLEAPLIGNRETIRLPKGLLRHTELNWLLTEAKCLYDREKPSIIGLKETEVTARRGNSYIRRLENETSFIIAAAHCAIKKTYKKVKATIAKDLGLKGKPKYLETKLDTSVLVGYQDLDVNEMEAALIGWSLL